MINERDDLILLAHETKSYLSYVKSQEKKKEKERIGDISYVALWNIYNKAKTTGSITFDEIKEMTDIEI